MLEQKLLKVQDQDFMLGKSGVFKLSLLVFIINLFKENLKASKPSNNININLKVNININVNINVNINNQY